MDALEREIENKSAEVAELRARLRSVELEVRTLEKAASLRPVSGLAADLGKAALRAAAAEQFPPSKARGKSPGTISNAWREVLLNLSDAKPFKYHDLLAASARNGMNISASAARDRARAFAIMGYLDGDNAKGFSVSDLFRARFTNKAPSAEASGPAEILHPEDQSAAV